MTTQLPPREVVILGLYYYFKKMQKERKDIESKAMEIKEKYKFSDEEFEKVCYDCYKAIMEE